MAENKRKCFKCGRSSSVKVFRFPKPAVRNLLRCELWAQYIFPDREYSSIAFQRKLHDEHRMLCQKHFRNEDFTDASKTKLLRTAVPSHNVDELFINTNEPQPGPSNRLALRDITNSEEASTVQYDPAAIEKIERDKKNLQAKCTKYVKKIWQMKNRINTLKSKSVLNAIAEDKYVQKLSLRITPAFALLLQGQLRNVKRKARGRRWSKEEKITALRIYKRSPTCYRLLRRLFSLPSPSTLKSLLNRIPFGVGVNQQVFKVLKKFVRTQKPSENIYTLMFDEMSLKKHMFYNSKQDVIEGFQDHGAQGRSSIVAGYALVFMIAGVRRKVKQPIAHYFSSGFSTADRLAVLIKEVLHQCFEIGLNIEAIVCDMDGVNRRALSILGASLEQPYITMDNKEIVTLFDTPHLLKCFRNLFMKYNIECTSNVSSGDKMGIGIAKWDHIKQFYDIDNLQKQILFLHLV